MMLKVLDYFLGIVTLLSGEEMCSNCIWLSSEHAAGDKKSTLSNQLFLVM